MFLVGCIASVVAPANRVAGATLWDWLTMNKQSALKQTLGERVESVAQSS
jgi:hypothetical protein